MRRLVPRTGARMLFAAALTLVGAGASTLPAAAQAQTDGQISLAQLGYGSGLALQGSAPTATLIFPLPSGGIQRGQLDLHVEVGPAVDDQSSLRLAAPDSAAAEASVAQLRETGVLPLPVGVSSGGALAVQVNRANIAGDG